MVSLTADRTAAGVTKASVAVKRSPSNGLFWLKLALQAAFGLLTIADSFYLIACYITADFFGYLVDPLLAWVQVCGAVAWALYFPTLAGALLSVQLVQSKRRSRHLVPILVVAQAVAGLALYLSQGRKSWVGYTLLFGPNVRMPAGNIATCMEAFVCLIPLVWISMIHIVAAFRAGTNCKITRKFNLAPFVAAGFMAFLLYAISATIKSIGAGQAIPVAAYAMSLVAHLAGFILIFLVLQWITVLANCFSNPAAIQFVIRSAAAVFLLAFIIRRIIFSLLAFNTYTASLYALGFSLTVVLFVSVLALRIKQQRLLTGHDQSASFSSLGSRGSRAFARLGILALFYLIAIKFASVDWEHIISSLSALAMCLLLLWVCHSIGGRSQEYRLFVLVALSITVTVALASIRFLSQGRSLESNLANKLEQYSDYDPSFFVIQLALKPAVEDEAYAGFYNFLKKHANLRIPVPTPEFTLIEDLKAGSMQKPNVFILVIDALRRDYLSPYNPAVTFTPRIQAFAGDSVVFQNAHTPYAGTALAEPSIWAGYQQIQKIFPPPHPRVSNLQRMLDVDGFHSYISYDDVLYDIVPPFANVTVLSSRLTRWQEKEFGMVIDEFEGDVLQRKDAERPIFLYTQPADVHTLSLAFHGGQVDVTPHPGFNDKYASAVENVDRTFGAFIEFLKKQNLYENSIIIVTADHGESLGEMGRLGHISNVTPEVVRIPFVIHLPEKLRAGMFWDATADVCLHDLTPTLYYLLGHRPLKRHEMLGRPLFTLTAQEQAGTQPDHFFLMSSYVPVFGILSQDQKKLFAVDASLQRNYYYNLADDPRALKNRITAAIREHYEPILRKDLEKIDRFYGLTESQQQQ